MKGPESLSTKIQARLGIEIDLEVGQTIRKLTNRMQPLKALIERLKTFNFRIYALHLLLKLLGG